MKVWGPGVQTATVSVTFVGPLLANQTRPSGHTDTAVRFTSSPSIGTALNPYIGYEEAAKVIKASVAEGKDLRTVVLERGLLTEEEVDRALDVEAMTKGGILK